MLWNYKSVLNGTLFCMRLIANRRLVGGGRRCVGFCCLAILLGDMFEIINEEACDGDNGKNEAYGEGCDVKNELNDHEALVGI